MRVTNVLYYLTFVMIAIVSGMPTVEREIFARSTTSDAEFDRLSLDARADNIFISDSSVVAEPHRE
ncbi:hypothetical protein BYT27DRAFT_7183176 [Phlegmacium glaucopus]|nr:hypothetical protein BYT27DRAFT_7183176 [Phlegmacium glaucopus]